MKKLLAVSLFALLAAAPAFAEEVKQDDVKTFEFRLTHADGKDAGSAALWEGPHGLIVRVEATGLKQGWHGVHFHATGDCSDHGAHFKKSGGHAMKEDQKHGLLSDEGPHAGDLPNIYAGADGVANAEFFTSHIGFDMLRDKDGGALMIHASPDDYKTDPSGNSGDRMACGVIEGEKE